MFNRPFSELVADLNHNVRIENEQVVVEGERKLTSKDLEANSVERHHVDARWFVGINMTVIIREDKLWPRIVVKACYKGDVNTVAVTELQRVPTNVLRSYVVFKEAAVLYKDGKYQTLAEALETYNGEEHC